MHALSHSDALVNLFLHVKKKKKKKKKSTQLVL